MRLFKILLILLLSLSLIACGKECTEHRDEDRDCRCDMCDEILPPMPCDKCEDGDGDGLCDACGEECGDRDIVLSEGEIRIVCAKGLGGTANKAIAELIKRLQEFGIEAQRAEDGAKDGAYTDIIIGRVSSLGEKYLVDGHDYGREGYTIKRIDSKIVIV